MQQPKMSKEMQQQMNKEIGINIVFGFVLGIATMVLIAGVCVDSNVSAEGFTVVSIMAIGLESICWLASIGKVQQKWFAKAREENEAEQKRVSQSTDTGKPQGSLREYRFEMHSADSQKERAFCPYCGNKIEVKSTMYCEQCGKKM